MPQALCVRENKFCAAECVTAGSGEAEAGADCWVTLCTWNSVIPNDVQLESQREALRCVNFLRNVSLGCNYFETAQSAENDRDVWKVFFRKPIMLNWARHAAPRAWWSQISLGVSPLLPTHRHIRVYTASKCPVNPENTVTVKKSLTACNLQTDRKCLISILGAHQTFKCASISSFTF